MAKKMTEARAKEIMGSGFHCSQVVMYHAAEMMGIDTDYALRMSAGLGGGCYRGDTCGVISAGAVALGILYGFDKPGSTEQNRLLIAKVKEFQRRFVELNGATLCRELLGGYDFSDPESKPTPTTWSNCGRYCRDACEILDDMLGWECDE